jgi:hypothetical protein
MLTIVLPPLAAQQSEWERFVATATYTYNFGTAGTIYVTVSTVATTINGITGTAYAITSITGTFEGKTITGMLGSAAKVQSNSYFQWDNAIFTTGGYHGSNHGIDYHGIAFTTSAGDSYNLFTNGSVWDWADTTGASGTVTLASSNAPCFLAGTLIATPEGERAVETLAAGDLVLTAAGHAVPVRWIGFTVISGLFADHGRLGPIRIAAGALGENLPARDLLVSPGHALFLDGALVNAAALVNGTTIRREQMGVADVTYYHVELDTHTLILAEGAPTESFLDGIEGVGFVNWSEREAPVDAHELPYPRVKSARQLPRTLRARLDARVAAVAGEQSAAA